MYNQECQNTYPNVETNKQTNKPAKSIAGL